MTKQLAFIIILNMHM